MPNLVLKRFMVFNANEGQQEGCEKDKLLFHWTKDQPDNKVSLTQQLDDVCLCDASVNTSIRLSTSIHPPNEATKNGEDCRDQSQGQQTDTCPSINESGLPEEQINNRRSLVLTFETTLVVVVEVEPEQSIWIAVHVSLASNVLDQSTTSVTQQQSTSDNRLLDPSCISSEAIERFVGNIYSRFCLINGTFSMIIQDKTDELNRMGTKCDQSRGIIRNQLRRICEDYFSNVLSEIHLNSMMTNLPSLYNFIVYLDLNPLTLMKVNSFINHLVCIDADRIRYTIAIFNDQLLWSSMNIYDTRLVYNYLISVLIRDSLQEELSRDVDRVRRIKEDMPVYLSEDRDEMGESLTNLSLSDDSKQKKSLSKFYLTVFRSSNNMTLGLVLSENGLVELMQRCELFLTSDSRMGVIPLASLAQSVGQNFLKANSLAIAGGIGQSSASKQRQTSGSSKNHALLEQKYLYLDTKVL